MLKRRKYDRTIVFPIVATPPTQAHPQSSVTKESIIYVSCDRPTSSYNQVLAINSSLLFAKLYESWKLYKLACFLLGVFYFQLNVLNHTFFFFTSAMSALQCKQNPKPWLHVLLWWCFCWSQLTCAHKAIILAVVVKIEIMWNIINFFFFL